MKKYICLISILAPINVWADNMRGFYVGAGVSDIDAFEYPTKESTVNIKSVELFGGYRYNDLAGIEIRYGGGFKGNEARTRLPGSDTIRLNTEYEIDSFQSIYYKPELLNYEAKLYALLGWTTLERAVTFNDFQGDVSQINQYIDGSPTFDDYPTFEDENDIGDPTLTSKLSGYSYGLGMGFIVNPKLNINVEYRIILDKGEEMVRAAGIYFDYRI